MSIEIGGRLDEVAHRQDSQPRHIRQGPRVASQKLQGHQVPPKGRESFRVDEQG